MSTISDIRDGLVTIIQRTVGNLANGSFVAEVTAVDLDNRSCTVIGISDEVGVEYPNVWLMPVVDDGILYVPKIGSTVVVQNNTNMRPYVSMWSELDNIMYIINNTMFTMSDGLTQFNKGENLGLVNIKPLVEKINAIENLLNGFITLYNGHIHPLTIVGTTGVSTPTTSTETNTIAPITSVDDLEDKAVTH